MEEKKSKTEIICESLLIKIDRELKLSKLLDEKVDDDFIDKLTTEWLELMNKSLEKYR